ncbi:MAG: hypothetical protein RL684_2973 [Pseudomonadota bacterium]|jgi:enterochelin esterase family protein
MQDEGHTMNSARIFSWAMAVLVTVLGAAPAGADEPTSPDIHADGTVTFRLKAPDATHVVLNGDWPGGAQESKVPLVKDEQGMWSVTVGPIQPDLWTYSFSVDGIKVPDDINPHYWYDRWGSTFGSLLLVPGPGSHDYETQEVPHGTVSAAWYPAPSLKIAARRAYVYTPAGYETGHVRYPVLYLSSNEETGWLMLARAPTILDNLIASGRSKPMIVVMLNTQPDLAASTDAIDEPLPSTIGRPSRNLQERNPHGGRVSSAAFPSGGTSIADDLVPFIDKRYRTLADRDHRAVAGLSASGAASFYGAMSNVRVFGSVGLFSGGLPALPGVWLAVPTPANAAQFYVGGPDINQSADMDKVAALLPGMDAKADFRLLYFAVGTNDPLLNTQRLLTKLLDERGVKHVALEVPGNRHDWRFWRWCLVDFAPRLFR